MPASGGGNIIYSNKNVYFYILCLMIIILYWIISILNNNICNKYLFYSLKSREILIVNMKYEFTTKMSQYGLSNNCYYIYIFIYFLFNCYYFYMIILYNNSITM